MARVKRFYQFDGEGNTCAFVDSSEAITDTFDYDAWGNEVARTGTTPTPFCWNGQVGYYWDEATGTYQIRRRSYEVHVGRFFSSDPIWPQDDNNAYRYVLNNCVNLVDPSGLGIDEGYVYCHRSSFGSDLFACWSGGCEGVPILDFYVIKNSGCIVLRIFDCEEFKAIKANTGVIPEMA